MELFHISTIFYSKVKIIQYDLVPHNSRVDFAIIFISVVVLTNKRRLMLTICIFSKVLNFFLLKYRTFKL